jgi:hypothetical protein
MVAVALVCVASPVQCKPPRDQEIYQNTLEEQAWKRHIEQQMQRELSGEKPPWHDRSTWKDYWTAWYSEIRISPALPWKGSEFKTHEDMIRYIKHRLNEHRLPTYE